MRQKAVAALEQIGKLLLLHGESPFRAKHYTAAATKLKKADLSIEPTWQKLAVVLGVGAKMAKIIQQLLDTGTVPILDTLTHNTPHGLLALLRIRQLGPRRLRTLWQTLAITTPEKLLAACAKNKIASLKGFGPKTQALIEANTTFFLAHQGVYRYDQALHAAQSLCKQLKQRFPEARMEIVGALRRGANTVTTIPILISLQDYLPLQAWLDQNTSLIKASPQSKADINLTFYWHGHDLENGMPVHIYVCLPHYFAQQLVLLTGSDAHLALTDEAGVTLRMHALQSPPASETQFYAQLDRPCYPPALREGMLEKNMTASPLLINLHHLKGVLHCHTTYSDGVDDLAGMARYAYANGYAYIGITDHSQAAAYAGGLSIEKVKEQQKAIDQLNKELAPFKIFKGIEVDILPNGDLDYPSSVLSTFDFVIASVHSAQSMDKARATDRLLKAIANPYTTIIGHLTGRLLLQRPGYPIDHQAIIRACAKQRVVIELNANPARLDMDWRWISEAMAQGVLIGINPDAHAKERIADMQYGVAMARKGGLTVPYVLNAMNLQTITSYFAKRKLRINT